MILRLLALVLLLLSGAAAAAQEGAAEAPVLSQAQADALAAALESPEARAALIETLQGLAGPAAVEEAEAPPEEEQTFGRQIAMSTQAWAEAAAERAERFLAQLSNAPRRLASVGAISPKLVIEATLDLALVFAVTVGLFFALRLGAQRLFRSIGERAEREGLVRQGLALGGSLTIDAGVVLLAWAGGYGAALFVLGDLGQIGIRQTLYLNAFLAVELTKVAIRGVLAPSEGRLRPVGLPDAGAQALYRVLAVCVSLIGYGQFLVVPIVTANVTIFAGRGLSTLISALTLLILIGAVLRWRAPVADWLRGERQRSLADLWHVPALIYLAALLAIVVTRPGGVLTPVLLASAKVLAAVVVGGMTASLLGRAIARGVHLPPKVNTRLPLLERRLNAFVPRALVFLRIVIFAAVTLFALDTIELFDAQALLASRFGVEATAALLSSAAIIVAAFVIWLALSSWVDYRLNPDAGAAPTAREQTLLTLFRNAFTVLLVIVTLMFVLSELGIDIAPLIASAGVLGLAIGFGAQKLVQDIITGVFIQLENAMNVGDFVTVGGTSGTVERLTIRSVSLRDLHGAYHIVPFSSVDMVSNFMRDFGYHVADIGIAYREDVEEAKQAMHDAFDEVKADPAWAPYIRGDYQWFGLTSFGVSAIVVRGRIRCAPGYQWGVGRAYNAVIKRLFDERGIEMPFPHQTIYFGENKDGSAPAARVRMEGS